VVWDTTRRGTHGVGVTLAYAPVFRYWPYEQRKKKSMRDGIEVRVSDPRST
jgi:hypothetical protein